MNESWQNDKQPFDSVLIKDEIIFITDGEYSSKVLHGSYKVLQQFDLMTATTVYLTLHPEQRGEYHFSNSMFLEYLVENQLLELINQRYLSLGGYGTMCLQWGDENEYN